jgi:hypothetical protein
LYPADLKYKNGSAIEFHLHDSNPANNEISVGCENPTNHEKQCSLFEFSKNLTKSTSKDWFGTLRILKKLNYLEKSIYQIVAVAQNSGQQISKMTYEIKVLPNMNKAPILSDNSRIFHIYENEPQVRSNF